MSNNARRVLLFDDDYESLRALKDFLEKIKGWQVTLTAREELLQDLGSIKYDLVLVDTMIPPLSLDAEGNQVKNVHFDGVSWLQTGLEFLKRLRQGEFAPTPGQGTSPDVPVIVLSAVAHFSFENAMPDGFAVPEYVEKPFRLSELKARIEKLMQE
jgi:CheY-like chemotaxis protein